MAEPAYQIENASSAVGNRKQGIFVLGLPYALLHSGFCGLLLIITAAALCCYTGNILIACLYEDSGDGHLVRVRDTYQDIANVCCRRRFSRAGGAIVCGTQVLELVMTCILYLIVSANLLSHSFLSAPVTEKAWCVVACTLLLPCVFIRTFKMVSKLSLLCSLVQFVIVLLVISYCLSHVHTWSWGRFKLSLDFEHFLVAIGVIIFSYTSQIFLPTLEGSMANRGAFGSMLCWTHFFACLLKTAFALAAFLTWGSETKEVITDNLPTALQALVNMCLVAKALLSYPLPFHAAAEVLQACLLPRRPLGLKPSLTVPVLRATLLLFTLLMALYMPHFAVLMGLTGSVTGAAMAFLLPSLFHLQLKWIKLSNFEKVADIFVFSLGLLCSLAGIVCSVKSVIKVFMRK